MVHATALVESLAQAWPSARIVIAGDALAREVYGGNPHVSELLCMPSPVRDFRGALRTIRARRLFDGDACTTLLTTGNERTKITLWAILAAASRRIGFAVAPELVHEPLAWEPAGSQIANNLRLLETMGLRADISEPRIYPSAAQVAAAEALLVASGSSPERRRVVLVTQTSPTQRKGWQAQRWIALANQLARKEDADLVFVGTAAEAPAIDAIRAKLAFSTITLAGSTGIAELAAVFTRCDFGVTLDTGPLHVGRAVGLPMAVIAPAWSPVHEWLPVGDPRFRILKNRDFPPPAPDNYIIDEVTVDEVMAAAQSLSSIAAANRAARERPAAT